MYQLVKIPLFANQDFFSFSKEEAKEYLQWFLSIKEERINILEEEVKIMNPDWVADCTKDSLEKLYNWFRKNIAYRPMSEDETKVVLDQISNTPQFVNVIPIPTQTFEDKTVSICFDIGCYFSEIFRRYVPDSEWTYQVSSKNYIYYAQPILVKKGVKVDMNPRAFMEGIARRILDDEGKEITFINLLDTWVKTFGGVSD